MFASFGFLAYFIFAKVGAIVVLIIGIIFGIVILLIISSACATFIQVAWVLFFQEISLEKQKIKLMVEKIETEAEVPNPEIV